VEEGMRRDRKGKRREVRRRGRKRKKRDEERKAFHSAGIIC
jgi:hypothetical protein